MKLVSFKVYGSDARISVNPEAVAQVGTMPGIQVGQNPHGYIHRIDGGMVEVEESYETVLERLAAEK